MKKKSSLFLLIFISFITIKLPQSSNYKLTSIYFGYCAGFEGDTHLIFSNTKSVDYRISQNTGVDTLNSFSSRVVLCDTMVFYINEDYIITPNSKGSFRLLSKKDRSSTKVNIDGYFKKISGKRALILYKNGINIDNFIDDQKRNSEAKKFFIKKEFASLCD